MPDLFGFDPSSGQTPPFNPDDPGAPGGWPGMPSGTQGPSLPGSTSTSGINWSKILPWLVGGASSGLGAILNARAQGNQASYINNYINYLKGMAAQEQQRRGQLAALLLPSILQATGNRNPQAIAGVQGMVNQGFPQQAPATPPAVPGQAGQAQVPVDPSQTAYPNNPGAQAKSGTIYG